METSLNSIAINISRLRNYPIAIGQFTRKLPRPGWAINLASRFSFSSRNSEKMLLNVLTFKEPEKLELQSEFQFRICCAFVAIFFHPSLFSFSHIQFCLFIEWRPFHLRKKIALILMRTLISVLALFGQKMVKNDGRSGFRSWHFRVVREKFTPFITLKA